MPAVGIRELLGASDLFQGFDDPAMSQVVEAAEIRSLRRNDEVFAEGDRAEELFIVESGRVAIVNSSPDGRESVVALMEAGDLFGELPLFDGEGRSAEARALEPSQLVAVPYPPLQAVLEQRPELLWGVLRMMARRIRNTNADLADSVFLDVTGRTAKRILELAGDANEFILPLTQEELAGMVGASRERVNKAISAFIRLGWLEQSDRRYRIIDREQLTRRSR